MSVPQSGSLSHAHRRAPRWLALPPPLLVPQRHAQEQQTLIQEEGQGRFAAEAYEGNLRRGIWAQRVDATADLLTACYERQGRGARPAPTLWRSDWRPEEWDPMVQITDPLPLSIPPPLPWDALERWGVTPPPPPRAPGLCPATVSLTPSASLKGICNRQKPLWQPPPTASGAAAEVASLLMHP